MASTDAYLVGATIREGSFGRVVYGRHKNSGTDVAIKVATRSDVDMTSIQTEQRLSHRFRVSGFVPRLLSSFIDSECLYLVMECAFCDLEYLIQHRTRLPPQWNDVVSRVCLDILSGIEFLHSQQVIHGDIKPGNVLYFEKDGNFRLTDLGSAVDVSDVTSKARNLTGTSQYASPEVIRAHEVSFGSDLWSLGCTIYCLFEGKSPFHDGSESLVIDQISTYCKSPQSSSKVLSSFSGPPEYKSLVESLLQPKPEDRLGIDRDGTLRHDSIRVQIPSKGFDAGELKKTMSHLPPPSWRSASEMKDGALGWSVFLI